MRDALPSGGMDLLRGPWDYLRVYLSPLPLTSPPVGELFFPEAHGLCSMSALSAQRSTSTQAREPEAGNTPPSPLRTTGVSVGRCLPSRPSRRGPPASTELRAGGQAAVPKGVGPGEHSPPGPARGSHHTAGCEIHAPEFKTFDCGTPAFGNSLDSGDVLGVPVPSPSQLCSSPPHTGHGPLP